MEIENDGTSTCAALNFHFSIFHFPLILVFQRQIPRRLARLPIGRAEPLGAQRFQHAQGFFHAAADVHVADDLVGNHGGRIDDKSRAQRDIFFFIEHAVGLGSSVLLSSLSKGYSNPPSSSAHERWLSMESTLTPRIARVFGGEVLGHLAEAGHFRRTDEGEVGGIEKQHQPFSFVAARASTPRRCRGKCLWPLKSGALSPVRGRLIGLLLIFGYRRSRNILPEGKPFFVRRTARSCKPSLVDRCPL